MIFQEYLFTLLRPATVMLLDRNKKGKTVYGKNLQKKIRLSCTPSVEPGSKSKNKSVTGSLAW